MSGRHVSLHVHLVWAVKDRAHVVEEPMREWLWPAIAEKARELGSTFVVVGGTSDHVHVLTDLPPSIAVAQLVKRLKGASSRVAGLKMPGVLRWQAGYAAFPVSRSALNDVAAYVANQPHHHADGTVSTEFELPASRAPA